MATTQTANNNNGNSVAPTLTLKVDGMMCMGCVGKVTEVLESIPSVQNVSVSLETGLATMTYSDTDTETSKLIQLIEEEAGKKATIEQLTGQQTTAAPTSNLTLKVEGMTCMSCVGKVTEVLESIEAVLNVKVSLETGLATMTYSGTDTETSKLIQLIEEEAGKKATLQQTSSPAALTLKVEGMTCMSCVGKVTEVLESAESVKNVKVSLETGLATMTYSGSNPSELIAMVKEEAGKDATVAVPTLSNPTTVTVKSPSTSTSAPTTDRDFVIDIDMTNDEDPEKQDSASSPVEVFVTRMSVSGMTCTSCIAGVRNALVSINGVQSAKVNLLGGRAIVTHTLAIEETVRFREALLQKGYEAEVLETSKPGAHHDKDLDQNVEFRVHFGSEEQSSLAATSLHEHKAVDTVSANERTVTVRISPGHTKSSVLLHLEKDGRLGKMAIQQSISGQLEADRMREKMEATEMIDREATIWWKRFFMSVSMFIPILVIGWLNSYANVFTKQFVQWMHFFLATPVQFISGAGFYRGTYFAMKTRRATMDVLVCLSSSIAYFSSAVVLFFNLVQEGSSSLGHAVMFRVSAMIITMVLLGKWLETSAKRRAAAGVAALSSLRPDVAVLYDVARDRECHTTVPVNTLSVGDVVKVIPGDRLPTDGEVVKGFSTVDESMVTGESSPALKEAGDAVIGGTVNGSGLLLVKTTAVGEDEILSQIVTLVSDAQASRAPVEALADSISAWFVPGVIALSFLVFVGWYTAATYEMIPTKWFSSEGKFFFSLLFALETMVIACPCALGLATPTAVMVSSEVGAKLGILFRTGAKAVEAGSGVNTVVFDKTGTLTVGQPSVSSSFISKKAETEMPGGSIMLQNLMSVVESNSHHPLATAICEYVKALQSSNSGKLTANTKGEVHKLDNLLETPGCGVEATIDDGKYKVCIGSPPFVFKKAASSSLFTAGEVEKIDKMGEEGLSIVIGVVNGEYGVVYAIQDPIRPEAKSVVQELHSMGIRTALVTGDGSNSGFSVGRHLGILDDHIHTGALPQHKLEKVKAYEPACFVGDGVNDAPALTGATVGIAIGAGAPVAAESAPVVLVRSDLWGVVDALDLSQETLRRIRLNLVWAMVYNIISVPLAAGVLYPLLQVRVPPMVASGAMALSSTCVVLSSLTLRRYRPRTRPVSEIISFSPNSARRGVTLTEEDNEDRSGQPLLQGRDDNV